MSSPMRARAGVIAIATVGALVVVTGCAAGDRDSVGPSGSTLTNDEVLPDAEVMPLLETVPERSVAPIDISRLSPDLVPPTNRWFSGMVFGDEPMPVFPLPLSFRLDAAGFTFGVPTIESRPGLIAGPMTEHVTVSTDASSTIVSRYDEVSVTTTLMSDDTALADVTIARGSPVISYRATADHELALGVAVEPVPGLDGVWSAEVGGIEYALVAAQAELADDGRTVSLAAGDSANWVAVPEGATLEQAALAAASPLTGVEVAYGVSQGEATTTLHYVTDDGSPTLVGALPHHGDVTAAGGDGPACDAGAFATTYGPQSMCLATETTFTVPTLDPVAALDLSGLSDDDRAELSESVSLEAGSLPDLPADTYFGGKALARIATLLSLARELQLENVVESLQSRLLDELRTWTQLDGCAEREDRCFVYDPEMHGIVGLLPSFGSEEFNDHHFHYGSFIFAAAVLAEGDEALVAELRPMISLLVADIASSGGEAFPTRRAFDPYSGHSWASGISPFADGNNQESSSEAVAAHHAVALWGAVAGDAALEEEAQWMLALESHSARSYYTDFDTSSEQYAAFDRNVVGIVWDGKRDYATWFSAEPAAILGIQLLPMRPGTSESLAGDPERILANIAEGTAQGPAPQFADYLLMYQALADSEQAKLALEAARDLPYSSIDDGNSRSYLLAFIMVQR